MTKNALGLSRESSCYLVMVTTFSVVFVLGNVVGVKLIRAPLFSDLALTPGVLTYPLTFLLTDIVSEIWGEKRANFMVYMGFFMSLLMLAVIQMAMVLPGHPVWAVPGNPYGYETVEEYQRAFTSVFGINGKLLFGSMLGYLVAQLIDVRLFHLIRRATGGKYLWLRNNGSTMISQLIDTFIVGSCFLFWGLGMDFQAGLAVMGSLYVYKWFFAICDTPFVYLGRALLCRYLNIPQPGKLSPT